MYKNFKITEEERQQILESHMSHGYKKPLNEQSNDDSTQEVPNDVENDNKDTPESNITCNPTLFYLGGNVGNIMTTLDFDCGLGEDGDQIIVTVYHHSRDNSIEVNDDNSYSGTEASEEIKKLCVEKFNELLVGIGYDYPYINVITDVSIKDGGKLTFHNPKIDIEN